MNWRCKLSICTVNRGILKHHSRRIGRILLLLAFLISLLGIQPQPARAETGTVQVRVSQSSDDAEQHV